MYSSNPSIVYGFHGLDEDVALQILNNRRNFKQSHNRYDWLGQGTYFWEGEELYPNAGFKSQNHIQIAVLNPDCIKGIFLPRTKQAP